MSIESEFDLLRLWLEEIAKNTAQTRNAIENRGGGKGAGADEEGRASRFDRATDALAKRFESALARWQRTPVEKLVNSAFDGATARLGSITSSLLSQGHGLANRGFQGTLEGAQNQYAMERLSRQFAAVMLPVFQGMTYFAEQIEMRMRRMSGGEQNRMLGMGIGAYAGYRLGGFPGALAGGIAGSFVGGDAFEGGALRGAGIGAFAGSRIAGLPGAAVGAAVGAGLGSGAHIEGEGPAEYYRRLRLSRERGGEGRSIAGGGFEMVSHSLSVLAGGLARGVGIDTDMGRARPRAEFDAAMRARRGGGEPAAAVTPYKFEVGEAGSSYMRIQEAVMTATNPGANDAGPLKPIFDGLLTIIDLLAELVRTAGGTVPGPRAAAGAPAP